MKLSSTMDRPHNGRDDLQDWLTKGYVAFDKVTDGCCKTLAYACKTRTKTLLKQIKFFKKR